MYNPAPGGGGTSALFDQTLTALGTQIDCPNIPAGFHGLYIMIKAASDFPAVPVTTTAVGVMVNGDAGANYFFDSLLDANGVYGGSNNQAAPDTSVIRINCPAATITGFGNNFATARLIIPSYDDPTWLKNFLLDHVMYDAGVAANARTRMTSGFWNNTAAITRLTLIAKSNNLLAGSRMIVKPL